MCKVKWILLQWDTKSQWVQHHLSLKSNQLSKTSWWIMGVMINTEEWKAKTRNGNLRQFMEEESEQASLGLRDHLNLSKRHHPHSHLQASQNSLCCHHTFRIWRRELLTTIAWLRPILSGDQRWNRLSQYLQVVDYLILQIELKVKFPKVKP